jgi:hypothetical protein
LTPHAGYIALIVVPALLFSMALDYIEVVEKVT